MRLQKIKKTILIGERKNATVDLAQHSHLSVISGIAFGKEGEGYIGISYSVSMEKLEEAMRRMGNYIRREK